MKQSVIVYLKQPVVEQDEYFNEVKSYKKTKYFAQKKSVNYKEFYRAGLQDLKPDFIFEIKQKNLDIPEIIEYNGNEYKVIRVYQKNPDVQEITVQKKVAYD